MTPHMLYRKPTLERFGTMRELTQMLVQVVQHCDPVCSGHDRLPICSGR
ncbi:MAG: hypothetical protein M3068_14825 [Gemmatimonadota bacterium]|nr:hypothetical protein [Gemmatimonadota bacterium]